MQSAEVSYGSWSKVSMSGYKCEFAGCSKSYPKLWRLKEHISSAHTGEVGFKLVANNNI